MQWGTTTSGILTNYSIAFKQYCKVFAIHQEGYGSHYALQISAKTLMNFNTASSGGSRIDWFAIGV
ncbi:hypothetical protein DW261_03545 [Fusobacterium varium]|uniref:hypothetical protein n=1 Tax=Fusobacterium varium TaxID=856 RepID=UPI000E512BF4|nr:hypothetical protein [Fusobacterium varium]RHG37480.1 hypothetical protein DW261_03545 [Fusobacterium varium]